MSGMQNWYAIIRKTDTYEEWVNRYVVRAADILSAISIAQQIVTAERAVHKDYVRFLDITLEPVILGTGGGTVVALSGVGGVASTGERMPLFVCVRVWFRPQTGKPSQKYLRLPLQEGEVANDVVASGVITLLTNSYITPLMGLTGLVDPQGQTFQTAGVKPSVQERQLRRRRESREGFKRGWIPT